MSVMGGRVVLTPEAVGIKKSPRGAFAFLLSELARRGHRHPELCPQTPPLGTINLQLSEPPQRRHCPQRGKPRRKGGWGKRCSPQGPGRSESRVRNRRRFWLRGGKWPPVYIEMPGTRPNFHPAAISFSSVRPDTPS
jgi:hypothetical protein